MKNIAPILPGVTVAHAENENVKGKIVMSNVPTPHIKAQQGEIAKKILMPGDPLRAKFIAENYLTDAVCINDTRNMLGYTGLYKGGSVTVMGSGMGVSSIGIYSNGWINHSQNRRSRIYFNQSSLFRTADLQQRGATFENWCEIDENEGA